MTAAASPETARSRWRAALTSSLAALLITAPAVTRAEVYRDTSVEMTTVPQLDTGKYLGRWYEIARFPVRFEEGCVGVTADYALRDDGQIRVINTCRQDTLDGPVEQAEGRARVEGPGKLSVTFVPWLPFARGDYWVLYLDDDYSLSVVGAPSGKTGWILARSPQISAAQRAQAEAVLRRNGYDTSRLYSTPQPAP